MKKFYWYLAVGFLVVSAVGIVGCSSTSSSETTTTTTATTTSSSATTTSTAATTTSTSTSTSTSASTSSSTSTTTTILYSISGWINAGPCTSPEVITSLWDSNDIGATANIVYYGVQPFESGSLYYNMTTTEPGTYFVLAASAFGDEGLFWGGPGLSGTMDPHSLLPITVEVSQLSVTVATFEMFQQ